MHGQLRRTLTKRAKRLGDAGDGAPQNSAGHTTVKRLGDTDDGAPHRGAGHTRRSLALCQHGARFGQPLAVVVVVGGQVLLHLVRSVVLLVAHLWPGGAERGRAAG